MVTKPGSVARGHDGLSEADGEGPSVLDDLGAREVPRDQLDECHLEDGVEEMQPDEAARVFKSWPIEVIGSDEVFDASSAEGRVDSSSCRNRSRFIERFSGAASITICAESARRSPIATSMRSRAATLSPGPTRPLLHGVVERPARVREPPARELLVHVLEGHRIAREGALGRDAAPHDPGAHDEHPLPNGLAWVASGLDLGRDHRIAHGVSAGTGTP